MKQPISIEPIVPPTCQVFFQGEYAYTLNEYEFLKLRIEIVKGKLKGYSVQWEEKQHHIEPDTGHFDEYPNGLFEGISNSYRELILTRINKRTT